MIDKMLKGIDFGNKLQVDFIDIRFQDKYIANYQSQGGDLTANSGSRRGFATRVIKDGALGFASTTSIELDDLKKIIEQAAKIAKAKCLEIYEAFH